MPQFLDPLHNLSLSFGRESHNVAAGLHEREKSLEVEDLLMLKYTVLHRTGEKP